MLFRSPTYVKPEIAAQFVRPGRLFLCFMTILASDGISKAERCQHKVLADGHLSRGLAKAQMEIMGE